MNKASREAFFLGWFYRPLRVQARSHRKTSALEAPAVPVAAGLPAIGPAQATYLQAPNACSTSAIKSSTSSNPTDNRTNPSEMP